MISSSSSRERVAALVGDVLVTPKDEDEAPLKPPRCVESMPPAPDPPNAEDVCEGRGRRTPWERVGVVIQGRRISGLIVLDDHFDFFVMRTSPKGTRERGRRPPRVGRGDSVPPAELLNVKLSPL